MSGFVINPYLTVPAAPAGFRYWRVYINYTGMAAAVVAEFELRESPSGSDATGSGTASGAGSNPSHAVDNNNGTWWISNTDMLSPGTAHAIWSYDFGSGVTKDIQEVTIKAANDFSNFPYAPRCFHIQSSSDNSTWTTVWGERSVTAWTNAETRTFTRPSDYATTPQYGNDGSIGARTGSITMTTDAPVSEAITGLINGINTSATLFWSASSSAMYMKWDFGSTKTIDGFTFYQSNGAISHGTWEMSGSNDDSSYTTISPSFTLGGASVHVQSLINTTAYRYYKMTKTSGSTSASGTLFEIEFKIK